MRYRPLGQSGIEASAITFGAWAIGGWMWGGQDEGESIRAINASFDLGINFIDTAPMYGFGESERVVGKAVAGRRDRFVIATKCGLRWDIESDKGEFHFRTTDEMIDPGGNREVRKYNHPDSIRWEVEQSLGRLRTDYIDLLQTHWQESTTAIDDTAAAMLKLKDEGKVRAIGACNATADQLAAYGSVGPIDTDQERYSLLFRDADDEQLPYCRDHHLAFLAYSPIANGLLSGRMGPDRVFPPGDLRGTRPLFSVDNRRAVEKMLRSILPIAESRGVSLVQLILAWTLARAGVSHALVGIRSPEQATENAAAAEIDLSPQEIDDISDAGASVRLE